MFLEIDNIDLNKLKIVRLLFKIVDRKNKFKFFDKTFLLMNSSININ